MQGLTSSQLDCVQQLVEMGIDPLVAQRAAIKYDGNLERACNWALDGGREGVDDDDDDNLPPPPLIPAAPRNSPPPPPSAQEDEDLPPPHLTARDVQPAQHTAPGGAPPPYSAAAALPFSTEAIDFKLPTIGGDDKKSAPKETLIDLTGEDSADSPQSIAASAAAQQQQQKLLLPAPYASSTAITPYGPSPAHADDLQRALQASQLDADDKDDELTKAISMSMATLGSTDDEAIGMIEAIKPEERIRDGNSPVILRSTSNFMSGLSSYLQCLYAVPSFRNALFEYTPPPRARVDFPDYRDYWKGDSSSAAEGGSGLGMPIPVGGEKESRENRLIALQRLFALMHESRRAFVHISEVTRAFDLRESDFKHANSGWVYKIRQIHETIVDDLRIVAGETARDLLARGVKEADVLEYEKRAARRFVLRGRGVPFDDHIGMPLPPSDDEDTTACLQLDVDPLASPPQDLFTCLDARLVTQSPESPPRPLLHLLTARPDMLMFQLERSTVVTSLADFGTGANAASKRNVFRPMRKKEKKLDDDEDAAVAMDQEKQPTNGDGDDDDDDELVWLDRYWIKNRVKIANGRQELDRLEGEADDLKRRRRDVAVTPDGQDARELVRRTVKYLEKATGGDDSDREARQQRLRDQWTKVADELDVVVQQYDDEIAQLDTRLDSVFSGPEWQRVGPYRLSAILMHDGLYGRGTAWSVVRDDEGKWWRMLDTTKVETTLDQALSDPAGLKMNAGSTFLFYQKVDEDSTSTPAIPEHLLHAAALDNHEFAESLPESHSALVDSWNLPAVESLLQPEAIQIPLSSIAIEDDNETVKDIALDSAEGSPLAPPHGLMVDENAAATEKKEEAGVATPMSLDNDSSETEATAAGEALRLRGGATVEDVAEEEVDVAEEDVAEEDGAEEDGAEEDEEGSDYDDDEIDEDEVELGLLQPMPAERDAWDIDYAIGKVGGVSRWLDPRSPLSPEDVQCGICSKTMSLLLQVNSPDDSRPHAAARSLYVYACRSAGCLAKDAQQAIRVWRTQMESPNAFYPHTEETQAERRRLEDALDPTSALSGPPSTSAKPWPEYDIAAEPEPYEESYLPDPSAPAPQSAEPGNPDIDAPDTRTGVDSAFLIFQERIEREPKQVLRFYRIPGVDDPQPLWASNRKIAPEEIPTCELCRGERKVEFQVLSTLLPSLKDDALDFDSLLVYTCASNCPIPPRVEGKTGWQAEVAFKQDFAAAGVKFGVP